MAKHKVSKALVTGGAGFIGSNIVDKLLSQEIETYVIDDLSTGSLENLAQHNNNPLLHILIGNIKDIDRLLPKDEDGIDVIFHEAAIANVSKSVSDPMVVHDVNVNMTLELMNFCLKRRISKFIFASSAAVYGLMTTDRYNGISEDGTECRPLSPYGASKLAVENYIHAYAKTYGLKSVILRYFNVFGPRQGYSDYSGVITIFINKLFADQSLTIYGDGQQIRDFIHVRDVARANMLSMTSAGAIGETFNVASGTGITIIDLAEATKKATGRKNIEHRFEPARAADMKFALGSIRKIREKLGFKPQISVTEGLAEIAADYYHKKIGKNIGITSSGIEKIPQQASH